MTDNANKCPACRGYGKITRTLRGSPMPYRCTECSGTGWKPGTPEHAAALEKRNTPKADTVCPACGHIKKSWQIVDVACFRELPAELKARVKALNKSTPIDERRALVREVIEAAKK